jgi:hypothetical protein
MSVEYTYDEKNNVLYTRFYGVVTNRDFKDQGEAISKDGRIKPGVRELVDLSGIEGTEASQNGLAHNIQIDNTVRDKLAGMRTAVIAKTDLLYGLARVYQSMAEVNDSPAAVEVFRSEEEARDWLGLQEKED